MERYFKQLTATGDGYAVALADDGTAWQYIPRDHAWRRLSNLPKREADNDN